MHIWVLYCTVELMKTVLWYPDLPYTICSSVQRLLSALSCFVRPTQGFIKCMVGRHDTGGLWKCVLVWVCSFTSTGVFVKMCSPSQHACLYLHMITCVHLGSVTCARGCVFFCFPTQGLCPLKGVPSSQLRERKTRSQAGPPQC